MKKFTIASGSDVPADFGVIRTARKKKLVRIREPKAGGEQFKKSWGDLTALPGEDFVICAEEEEYPCKIDIFKATYEETAPNSGQYRKVGTSRLVQVPEGVECLLKTKEGEIAVQYPDYVVIGEKNEVYANGSEWVEQNLEFLD